MFITACRFGVHFPDFAGAPVEELSKQLKRLRIYLHEEGEFNYYE